MRRLMLLRHGKSDWHTPHGSDHDRPLNHRGVEAAETMGRLLARADLLPDHVITSSAVRALTTAELARSAGQWGCAIDVSDELYGTTAGGSLKVAARAPTDAESLLLVGHEPTWSQLAHHLTGAYVAVKTATVIGIDLPIDAWRHVDSRGSLEFVLQPRNFTGWLGDLP